MLALFFFVELATRLFFVNFSSVYDPSSNVVNFETKSQTQEYIHECTLFGGTTTTTTNELLSSVALVKLYRI